MRLLHTSDWHLGRSLHGADLLVAQGEFLTWLADTAVEHAVDAVLVAGDVYDRAVPSVDAVRLLDRTLVEFAQQGIPVVISSGNHDSAVRLGFGGLLQERAGIHLRTEVGDLSRPVVLRDEYGEVGVYGVPYLLPDAVMAELEAERSHTSVLAAATARILTDAAERGLSRTVAVAHAFVTGAQACDSERDIRVGGIGDAPACVFEGLSYVALGHLHGPQAVPLADSATVLHYSGSPLAFSFSERDQTKSVLLVDIDGDGAVTTTPLPAPVPRPLREVRGTLDELLARADTDLADLAEAYVKAVLTDNRRPNAPMERLREKWPHTLVLDFQPEGALVGPSADLARLAQTTDPVEVCELFVHFVGGAAPDDAELVVLREVVESVTHCEERV